MKLIGSVVWGVILGAAAVLLHDAYVPFGLILALLGTAIGVWLPGRAWGVRRYKITAAIGWATAVLIGGMPGVGGELLVQGNFAGNALVIAGLATVVFAVVAPV
ncbi:MAG TPA: hypothetical protein VGJ85_04410 [Candidatus Nanopelagicaceae bacterium]|jgi:hypothetical protein